MVHKHHKPTFFFLNKTDRVGADVERVLKEIRENLTEDVFDITEKLEQGEMSERLIESIAERNENLLELYMEKKLSAGIMDSDHERPNQGHAIISLPIRVSVTRYQILKLIYKERP